MIALKSFVLDQIYILKKKSFGKQILSDIENKALINNLTDQIEFLKKGLHSEDTIINPFYFNLTFVYPLKMSGFLK